MSERWAARLDVERPIECETGTLAGIHVLRQEPMAAWHTWKVRFEARSVQLLEIIREYRTWRGCRFLVENVFEFVVVWGRAFNSILTVLFIFQ